MENPSPLSPAVKASCASTIVIASLTIDSFHHSDKTELWIWIGSALLLDAWLNGILFQRILTFVRAIAPKCGASNRIPNNGTPAGSSEPEGPVRNGTP